MLLRLLPLVHLHLVLGSNRHKRSISGAAGYFWLHRRQQLACSSFRAAAAPAAAASAAAAAAALAAAFDAGGHIRLQAWWLLTYLRMCLFKQPLLLQGVRKLKPHHTHSAAACLRLRAIRQLPYWSFKGVAAPAFAAAFTAAGQTRLQAWGLQTWGLP
jgi:hypothetical protein